MLVTAMHGTAKREPDSALTSANRDFYYPVKSRSTLASGESIARGVHMSIANDGTGKTVWQRGTMRIMGVFAILFLIAFVALATPQERDHDRDRDRDYDRDGIHLSHERIPRDFGGGHGGRPSPDAQCEPGFVAVGFHVQTGEYFNQIWLDCARLRPDGSLGDEERMTERTGSPGGHQVHDAHCPEWHALRGLRGRTGASIDEASGECSPIRQIAERRDDLHTVLTEPVLRPHAEGRPAGVECPPGAVVTGFQSMSGTWMDHLWIVCSELRRND